MSFEPRGGGGGVIPVTAMSWNNAKVTFRNAAGMLFSMTPGTPSGPGAL